MTANDDPPTPPAPTEAPRSGPVERARLLAQGIAERVLRAAAAAAEDAPPAAEPELDLEVEEAEDGLTISAGPRLVARLGYGPGFVRAEVDPRTGVGDAVALRRLGRPHRDPARSASGWRMVDVRTRRDASELATALKGRSRMDAPGMGVTPAKREGPARPGIVRVAHVADAPRATDGFRVFVDRLWPRGLPRAEGDRLFEAWLPAVAPSDPLRLAFGHGAGRFRTFRHHYLSELKGSARAEIVSQLRARARKGPVTLVTATRDVTHSHAAVLAEAVARGRTPRG